MISAGKVQSTQSVSSDAIAKALFNDVTARGELRASTKKKLGIEINGGAEFNRIAGLGNSVNVKLLAGSAPDISGSTRKVDAAATVVDQLFSKNPDVACHFLANIIKDAENE